MATVPKTQLKPNSARSIRVDLRAPKARFVDGTSVAASKAKTHLLELLNTVDHSRASIVITKRGRPVAKLIPIEEAAPRKIFGWMKGSVTITGDVVGPEPDIWNAMVE